MKTTINTEAMNAEIRKVLREGTEFKPGIFIYEFKQKIYCSETEVLDAIRVEYGCLPLHAAATSIKDTAASVYGKAKEKTSEGLGKFAMFLANQSDKLANK